MAIEGHAHKKYVTGHCLNSSRDRGWDSMLVERWTHACGELSPILPRDTELVVLLSGATLVDRKGAGLKQHTHARRGTAWLCPSGVREDYIDIKQPVDDCLHIFLSANPFSHTMEQDLELDPARVSLRYDVFVYDPFIEQMALQIARELNDQTSTGSLLIEGLSRALSAYLVNRCTENDIRASLFSGREKPLDERRKSRVLGFLDANIDQPFTVADLAAIALMSPAHFARSFAQTFGVPPHTYVSARRLELAKDLLSREVRDLSDIAIAVGFSNASNFSRAFKRATGLTPTEYRQLGR